jgi:quinolinate synthase
MFTKEQKKLITDIKKLKKLKKAIILCHNYQRPEIYEVADFIGDSLGLCIEAQKTDAKIIVFSGVNFMAESAKILNPNKKVLLPNIDSGCAMSDMIEGFMLKIWKKDYSGVPVVCYVNSTAEVKAESDICCTSSNAIQVCKSLKSKKILFVPDKNLAKFVQSKLPEKEIIAWNGFCPIHHRIDKSFIVRAKKDYPNAFVLVHPECKPEVIELADAVCSTNQMISEVFKHNDVKEFIVTTECGMVNRLLREFPDKKFFTVCNMCFDMKKNTLEQIKECLENETNEILIPENVRVKAEKALMRMLEIK